MKENKPFVSIIVPIYNVEKYLRQCLDSIVKQTLENIEIILINDGSTDNCGKICDEYALKDKRIKVVHKKNAGLGAAYNTGLDLATGEYIGFVESDDWI
ncbi:glycosyltransferase [Campylobacter sp. W0018]|uniref:glycosyltransferase family 2 protein n=1 Tax=Campylobacter sp. W0018 TaxID=2735782 RepID=UPI00301D68DE|nr:glycosyltransferase [Campylobacter sp. W0018]